MSNGHHPITAVQSDEVDRQGGSTGPVTVVEIQNAEENPIIGSQKEISVVESQSDEESSSDASPNEIENQQFDKAENLSDSPSKISAVETETTTNADDLDGDEKRDSSSSSSDFEFALVTDDPEVISADEVFFNGKIRPVYPVFGRDLFLFRPGDDARSQPQPRRTNPAVASPAQKPARTPLKQLMMDEEKYADAGASCSSSECDELDGIPAESYCVWTPGSFSPSPEMKSKSKSTGTSSSRRWRFRDLVVRRSHSDGKKRFFFVTSEDGKGKERKGRSSSEIDVVGTHRLYYAVRGEEVSGDQRRSFLPYKKDLVGIFASVNGTSRNFHPF